MFRCSCYTVYVICVPCVTYACDLVDYSSKDKQNLHVALNVALRKIFAFGRWQSFKDIRESFGHQSVTESFANRMTSFERSLPRIGNSVLHFLHSSKALTFFSFSVNYFDLLFVNDYVVLDECCFGLYL